jgi:hypothetical protein
MDFDALTAQIKRPRKTIRLCLRADLFSERERIIAELARANSKNTLARSGASSGLTAKLESLNAEMEKHTTDFVFEAMPRSSFADLEDAFPDVGGLPSKEFLGSLLSATLIEPEITPAQVEKLLELLSDGQVEILENAAWGINRETGSVPF